MDPSLQYAKDYMLVMPGTFAESARTHPVGLSKQPLTKDCGAPSRAYGGAVPPDPLASPMKEAGCFGYPASLRKSDGRD